MSQEALYDAPKVGGDILAYCTRCKIDLTHVVVSMSGNIPLKVLCKTCKTERKYRNPGGKRPPSMRSTKKSPPKRTSTKIAELWNQKITESKSKPFQTYASTQAYIVGDVVKHATFGVGIVESARGTGKISVLFREGEKTLIHNMEQKE